MLRMTEEDEFLLWINRYVTLSFFSFHTTHTASHSDVFAEYLEEAHTEIPDAHILGQFDGVCAKLGHRRLALMQHAGNHPKLHLSFDVDGTKLDMLPPTSTTSAKVLSTFLDIVCYVTMAMFYRLRFVFHTTTTSLVSLSSISR